LNGNVWAIKQSEATPLLYKMLKIWGSHAFTVEVANFLLEGFEIRAITCSTRLHWKRSSEYVI
jgi:hypothetical protein